VINPKLLLVCRERPNIGNSGGDTYTLSVANYLAECGYCVRILSTQQGISQTIPDSKEKLRLLSEPIERWNAQDSIIPPSPSIKASDGRKSFFHNAKRYLKKLRLTHYLANFCASRFPHFFEKHLFAKPASKDELDRFEREFSEFHPSVVIANFVFMSGIFDRIPVNSGAKKVLLAHEVLSDRYRSYVRNGVFSGHWPWTNKSESRSLSKADMIIAIQEENRAMIQKMAPDKKVFCAPLAISPHPPKKDDINPRKCIFVGSGANHNTIGLNWFLAEVWPTVISNIPDASLDVFGTVCSTVSSAATGVNFCGPTPCLDGAYRSCSFVIVPLIVGGGLKIKLVEALKYGKATICTPIGIQGLEDLAGSGAFVENSAVGFAKRVEFLLNNPTISAKMGDAARAYAELKLSKGACYAPFAQALRSL
jgi:glycosyltransferase involved in cell wall biosynthesis